MVLPSSRWPGVGSVMLAGILGLAAVLGPPCLPAAFGGAVAEAQESVDIDSFHAALDPYGQWVDTPQYGEVWYPTSTPQGWRPYYDDGHWVYSDDDGWTWVSDLPWGWAPFHYGRWAEDPQYGWIWVPGRVWGPAWVTFRRSDEAIGWAPLPPDTGWDPGYGYQGDSNLNVSIGVDLWNFVRPEGFLEPRFDRYAYNRHDYPRIVNQTRNITNITVINNRIVNRSIDVSDVERVTHRKVEHFKLAESDRPDRTSVKGNNLVIYKPVVVERGESKTEARTTTLKEDPVQDNKKRATAATTKPGNQVVPLKQNNGETTNNKPSTGTESETLQTRQTTKQKQNEAVTKAQPGNQPESIQNQSGKEKKKKKVLPEENGTASGATPNQKFAAPAQQKLQHKPQPQQQEQGQPVLKKQKCKQGTQCSNNND